MKKRKQKKYGITFRGEIPMTRYTLGLYEYSKYSKNHWAESAGVGYSLEPSYFSDIYRQEIRTVLGNLFGERLYMKYK